MTRPLKPYPRCIIKVNVQNKGVDGRSVNVLALFIHSTERIRSVYFAYTQIERIDGPNIHVSAVNPSILHIYFAHVFEVIMNLAVTGEAFQRRRVFDNHAIRTAMRMSPPNDAS